MGLASHLYWVIHFMPLPSAWLMWVFHLSSWSTRNPRNLCSVTAGTVVCCIQMDFCTIGQVAGCPSGFLSLHLVKPIMPNLSIVNWHWWVFDHVSAPPFVYIMALTLVFVISRFLPCASNRMSSTNATASSLLFLSQISITEATV